MFSKSGSPVLSDFCTLKTVLLVRVGNSRKPGEHNEPEDTVLGQGDGLHGQKIVMYKETKRRRNYTEGSGRKFLTHKKKRHKYRKREGKNKLCDAGL